MSLKFFEVLLQRANCTAINYLILNSINERAYFIKENSTSEETRNEIGSDLSSSEKENCEMDDKSVDDKVEKHVNNTNEINETKNDEESDVEEEITGNKSEKREVSDTENEQLFGKIQSRFYP